jgi:hypothetical protein
MTIQYDPQKVTDWLTPLEKVYARQSQQLDRRHQQLRERDRQEEAATFTSADFNKILQGFSTLSKTAKAISTQIGESKYGDFQKGYEALDVDDQTKIEQITSETDLSLKGADLISKLRKKGVSEEALGYLELNAGHKNIRLKRLMGWQTLEKSISTIDSEIELNEKEKLEFERWAKEGKTDLYYKNKTRDALRKLGLNDKFIATHYGESIEQFSNTKGLTQKLDYKKVKFAQELEETVSTFSNLKANPTPLIASTELHNLVKTQISIDPIKGKSNAVIFLHRLNKDGKINSTVIEAMKQGKITDFDGGDVGEKLFSAADWKYIEQGEKKYQTAVITAHDDSWATQGLSARTAVINNEWDQNKFNDFLRIAKDNGQEEKQWYKDLSKINVTRQNQAVYEAEAEQLIGIAETGNLEYLKDEMEGATNSAAKDAAKGEIAFQEKHRKRLKYSERFLDIKVSEGLKLTLKTDEDLNWKGVGVRNDLLAYFRKDFVARIKADPNNPNTLNESMAAVNDYWEANGGADTDGTGKFSPTSNGTYDNFNSYSGLKSDAYSELNTVATESKVNKYTDRVNTAWNRAKNNPNTKGKNIIQRVLNTPESILDKEDIIAAYENTTISSEVRIKARQLGITPTQLLEWQTKALINGGDTYKEVVDLFDLKNKELPDPEKDLQEMVDDKDLLYLLRRVGIENTTPKQRFRLYQYLENRDASVKEKKEDQDTENKVNQRALRYEYMK